MVEGQDGRREGLMGSETVAEGVRPPGSDVGVKMGGGGSREKVYWMHLGLNARNDAICIKDGLCRGSRGSRRA